MKLKDACILERKNMTNLDSMLKRKDITLPIKVHIVKDTVFPVVMYGCWTIKKAQHWKNWCFWIMVLEKTLESPLDSKMIKPFNLKGNQPWIFFGRTEAEAEAPIFWLLEVKSWLKRPWFWEGLRAGGEADDREWDGWIASPIQWTWVWANSGRWWRTGKPGVLQSMRLQRVGCDLATEQQQQIKFD